MQAYRCISAGLRTGFHSACEGPRRIFRRRDRSAACRLELFFQQSRSNALIAQCLGAEQERWFPWAVVGFGAGIALYFSLWPTEPPFAMAHLSRLKVQRSACAALKREQSPRLRVAFFCFFAASALFAGFRRWSTPHPDGRRAGDLWRHRTCAVDWPVLKTWKYCCV